MKIMTRAFCGGFTSRVVRVCPCGGDGKADLRYCMVLEYGSRAVVIVLHDRAMLGCMDVVAGAKF